MPVVTHVKSGWKVTTKDRHSCIVRRGNGGRHYPIGKWVEPAEGCGPFAVFVDLAVAQSWVERRAFWAVVHLCEYRPSRKKSLWRTVRGKVQRRRLEGSHPGSYIALHAPTGTVLADAVRCLD